MLSSHVASSLVALARLPASKLVGTLCSVGSLYSTMSLVCALLLAMLVTARARRRRGRTVRLKVVLRALFPRSLFVHPSTRADIGFFLLNLFVTSVLIDWAILSGSAVARWTGAGLAAAFGPAPLAGLPGWSSGALTTAALFLAYEFGYYADHWLSHYVPVRWALHKPHHTAEALSPLTNARVHPLESLVFANILGSTLGIAGGVCIALFGPGHEAMLAGRNAVFLIFWFALGHLQHSNVWITLPGPLGRWLMTPAHHQIHHSSAPEHFGKNLGSFLTLFDRLFGTLRHPSRTREPLTFGAAGDPARHHSVTGGLIDPVVEACAALGRSAHAVRGPSGARPAAPPSYASGPISP